MSRRLISLILSICLLFTQSGFAHVAAELNIAGHLASLHNSLLPDTFRPLHLRYLSFNPLDNNFKLLLDKGSLKNPTEQEIQDTSKTLMQYFLIGLTLPNDTFWVNLRPDSPDQIIDDRLAQTDIGKIMLETDLQLKKDTASFTSPQTPEGKEYWDKLYKKASELYGTDTVTIPTLTRPWIVPGEIIIRETADSAYIYKATLKVMLEQDYLKNTPNAITSSADYTFKDQRSKALNEYSTQLIRGLIIPKLTKEVNSSKRYAPLRQVYYSLIMAQWFKSRHKQGLSPQGTVPALIDKQGLTNLTSKEDWSKTTYFNAYKKSFAEGEYNIQEPHYTPTGQVIRSYMSGGEALQDMQFTSILSASPLLPSRSYLVGASLRTEDINISSSQRIATSSPIQGGSRDKAADLISAALKDKQNGIEYVVSYFESPTTSEKEKIAVLEALKKDWDRYAWMKKPTAEQILENLATKLERDFNSTFASKRYRYTIIYALIPGVYRQCDKLIKLLENLFYSPLANKEQREEIICKFADHVARYAPIGETLVRLFYSPYATLGDRFRVIFTIQTLMDNDPDPCYPEVLARICFVNDIDIGNLYGSRYFLTGMGIPWENLEHSIIKAWRDRLTMNSLCVLASRLYESGSKGPIEKVIMPNSSFLSKSSLIDAMQSLFEILINSLLENTFDSDTFSDIADLIGDWYIGSQGALQLPKRIVDAADAIKIGEMHENDTSHLLANYIILLTHIQKLKLSRELSYKEMLAIIQNRGLSEDGHPENIKPETMLNIRGLAYEASAMRKKIIQLQEKAEQLGKRVVVVANMSYGGVAVAPITEEISDRSYIAGEQIPVWHTKVGSTESHHDELVLSLDLFTVEQLKLLIQESPFIIVVDGSTSISSPDRTSPHIPDAYKGYRNYFIVLNYALYGTINPMNFYVTDDFVQELLKSRAAKELIQKIQSISLPIQPRAPNQEYKFRFWYKREKGASGKEAFLYLRGGKIKEGFAPKLSDAEIEKLDSSVCLFIQSAIHPEDIPENIKNFIGGEHIPAFFDDTEYFKSFYFCYQKGHGVIINKQYIDVARGFLRDFMRSNGEDGSMLSISGSPTHAPPPAAGSAVEVKGTATVLPSRAAGKLSVSQRLINLERYFDSSGKITDTVDIGDVGLIDEKTCARALAAVKQNKILKLSFNNCQNDAERVYLGTDYLGKRLGKEFGEYFTKDPDELRGTLRDLIRNAFVHGNAMDFSLPIFVNVDLINGRIEVYDINLMSDKSEAERAKILKRSIDVYLSGGRKGIPSIMLRWEYKKDSESYGDLASVTRVTIIPRISSPMVNKPPAAGSEVTNTGGIDFRSLPIVTQALSNLSAGISSSALLRLSNVNLNAEWQQIERMSSSGIKPSAERIREYAQASSALGKISQDKDRIILCIADILRQEEDSCCETDRLLRDILVALESVQQAQELKEVFLGKV